MCLANVRVHRDGEEEAFLEEVAHIWAEGGRLRLRTLLGDERSLIGRIREIDFVNSTVLIELEVAKPKGGAPG